MAIVLGVVGIGLLLWQAQRKPDTDKVGTKPQNSTPPDSQATVQRMDKASPKPIATIAMGKLALETALKRLKALGPENDPRKVLEDLRLTLSQLPPAEATKLVRGFLDAKLDAATRLDFKLRLGGALAEAPTLRVFLLDYLAQVDPAAAAEYAKVILNEKTSSDEWAVAMRDFSRVNHDAASRNFMEEKLKEMFNHDAWRQQPSVGYLEAFDVAVYLRGTGLVAPLASLVRDMDNRAVAHAAFLTLDRLTIAEPVSILSKLQAEPELMKGREQTRANYFARADVSDLQQRAVVEKYLLDSPLSGTELATFAGLFPSASYMVSYNLLTTVQTPSGAILAAKDRAALQVVNEWLNDPRFAKHQPLLQNIRNRLESFVKSQ